MEVQVLVALDLSDHDFARRVTQSRVRDVGVDRLPPLSAMVTFTDWANPLPRFGQEPIYAMALLATDRLVERHGAPAVMEYFALFASSSDRLANFRRAFGQELSDFQAEFSRRLADPARLDVNIDICRPRASIRWSARSRSARYRRWTRPFWKPHAC